MLSITRAFGVAFVSAALVTTSAQVASAETAQIDSPKISWQPCKEDATAECGTLRLPVDYKKPSGEKFDLAVARRKAADPTKRLGILVINPGGPGGSGVDFAIGAKGYFSQALQQQFDIVGFDPRGVARSSPVKCSVDVLSRDVSPYPRNQNEFDALVKYNADVRDDCRKQTGPIYDHVDTGNVIKDIDSIRAALGEKKISYYGISYGTIIGQQYAERYGDKIRAMVIDSNMDHSLGTWGFAATEAQTAESSFNEWVKWCDRNTSCALHGKDLVKVWHGLLAKADRGEVHFPGMPDRKLTARDIIGSAFGAFYGPNWKGLTDRIVALNEQKPVVAQAFAAAETAENPFPAVFCQDYYLPVRNFAEYRGVEALENAIAPNMRGGALGHSAIAGCIGTPKGINNPQHRLDIDKKAPTILMLNALYDPATGYAWAVNAHRQSKDKTVLLTYEGWGHGVYTRSDCTLGAVDTYLTTLKAPKDGSRCAAVEPPSAATLSEGSAHVPGSKPGAFGLR